MYTHINRILIMTYSTLVPITNTLYVDYDNRTNYQNSSFFPPSVWDILSYKLVPEKMKNSDGSNLTYICHVNRDELFNDINGSLLAYRSIDLIDLTLWDLSNQSIFKVADRFFITDSIRKFVDKYKDYDFEYNLPNNMKLDYIQERFINIANDIMVIDETKYKYFVLKSTNIENSVYSLFTVIDENDTQQSLHDAMKADLEFEIVNYNSDYTKLSYYRSPDNEQIEL